MRPVCCAKATALKLVEELASPVNGSNQANTKSSEQPGKPLPLE